MKTYNNYQPIVQQVNYNSTNWIGHHPGKAENQMAGQTFSVPDECPLEAIEIFSSIVTKPGKLTMTLHYYDPTKKIWGPPVSSCTIQVSCNESNTWLAFDLHGTTLHKGKVYGFRIESPDTYIGVGEAAGSYSEPPYEEGQEWMFNKRLDSGRHFSYFSLAFKVDTAAA